MIKRKEFLKLFLFGLIALTTLTGCMEKRINLNFKKDNYEITIKVKESGNYKLSQDLKDFRSSREDAMIIGKDYSVSIDISNEITYDNNKGSFEKLKKSHSKDKEFKEITISNITGFQIYNENYLRYEVFLPIKDDKDNCLIVCVYSADNKPENIKQKYTSDEVKDILNHITIKKTINK